MSQFTDNQVAMRIKQVSKETIQLIKDCHSKKRLLKEVQNNDYENVASALRFAGSITALRNFVNYNYN